MHERHRLGLAVMMLLTYGPSRLIAFILVIVAFVFASTAVMYNVVLFFRGTEVTRFSTWQPDTVPTNATEPHSVQEQASHTLAYINAAWAPLSVSVPAKVFPISPVNHSMLGR